MPCATPADDLPPCVACGASCGVRRECVPPLPRAECVRHPVASVGSVCGVGWVSASPPPIAPPVPSCALSQRPTLSPWLCPAPAHPVGIATPAPASPLRRHLSAFPTLCLVSVCRIHLSTTHAHISLTAYVFIPHYDLCNNIHLSNKHITV